MTSFKTTGATTLVALATALALAACERNDNRTAGQELDSTVASAEQKADDIKGDVARQTNEAKDDINRATDQASVKLKDMSITTAVNAELARDAELSALHINVDTANGHVLLRGSAPSDASRERAAALVSRVDGVVAVDNQLSVARNG